MTTTKQTLIDARALIADPKRWIKGEYTNCRGGYCSVGALAKVRGVDGSEIDEADPALLALAAQTGRPSGDTKERVLLFNDTHTHAGVLDLFDDAIKNEND